MRSNQPSWVTETAGEILTSALGCGERTRMPGVFYGPERRSKLAAGRDTLDRNEAAEPLDSVRHDIFIWILAMSGGFSLWRRLSFAAESRDIFLS
jgi:hypothetical protein